MLINEKLQENACNVGKIIQDGFLDLSKRHECIGDVRGAGLYVGVELVKDRLTKAPDSATALAVVNGLRAKRVLISATGFHSNTLKIRPPLVFSKSDADRLLTEAESVLNSIH